MSGSKWVTTPSWLSRSLSPFLYHSSVYSCYLFLISSDFCPLSCTSLLKMFPWYLQFSSSRKRSLVFPMLLFSDVCLYYSFKNAFLSPLYSLDLCIQLDISSPFPLPLASLLYSAICKAYSDNHFAFLHYFFFGMVLVTASCTML